MLSTRGLVLKPLVSSNVSGHFKAVELEVQRAPYLVELFKELIVPGDALTVGVDHDKANIACLCGANEIDLSSCSKVGRNLWM